MATPTTTTESVQKVLQKALCECGDNALLIEIAKDRAWDIEDEGSLNDNTRLRDAIVGIRVLLQAVEERVARTGRELDGLSTDMGRAALSKPAA